MYFSFLSFCNTYYFSDSTENQCHDGIHCGEEAVDLTDLYNDENDNDDDDVVEQVEADNSFPSLKERLSNCVKKNSKKLSPEVKDVFYKLINLQDDDVFSLYMPPQLSKILPKGHDGYRNLIKKKMVMGSMISWLKNINSINFQYSLAPGASVAATSTLITSSILSFVMFDFLRNVEEDNLAFSLLVNRPEFANLVGIWKTSTIPYKRKNISKHHDVLWDVIFPALKTFTTTNSYLIFDFSLQSNGVSAKFLFRDKSKKNAYSKKSAAVKKHGMNVSGYSHRNYLRV